MSRIECFKENGNQVAFGIDRVTGWFYQEFDKKTGECIADDDQVFTGLSRMQLVNRLHDTDADKAAINLVALDLDPEGGAR